MGRSAVAANVSQISTATDNTDLQADRNSKVWARGSFVGDYASRTLRPAEVLFLVRYREQLQGHVLELGCGAGRLTGYLLEIAESVDAIDLSPRMIDYCRRHYPRGNYSVQDLREVGGKESESTDVVVATYGVVDVLGDSERRRLLRDIRSVLVPGGLLMMSSHNLAYVPRLRDPTDLRARNIVRRLGRFALMPVRLRNRRRLTALESFGSGYAMLNDDAHNYRLLHYYVSRDTQERQFEEEDFEVIECLDNDGRPVPAGATGEEHVELYYLVRRPD